MGASARRRTLAKQLGSLPESFHSADCFPGEIVGADEEWIIVQSLRARRLVVGIVQANESISQKRCELATRLLNLRGRGCRRFEDFWYVLLHLHVGVMVVVDSRG